MSTSQTTNGTIKLTTFADLGPVMGLMPVSQSPSEESEGLGFASDTATQTGSDLDCPRPGLDLTNIVAQLASMSGGLDAAAREDSRAREEATLELARYEALVEEIQDAERSLEDARRVRASAQSLAEKAFSDEARLTAVQHAAGSRAIELQCMELLAERRRAAQKLAGRPQLARVLAERQRQADEQIEAARRAESERADRLATGLAAVDAALSSDDLDHARARLERLAQHFPQEAEVRRRQDIVRWRLRNRLIAPAEAALRDVTRRGYRDDPEAAVARLAAIQTEGLPEGLARRVFGIWSNLCWHVVQLRGWQDPRRDTPSISRGTIWARTPGGAYEVVSSLADPRWQAGQVVPPRLAVTAAALRADRRSQGVAGSDSAA
jgi:hypothetical protein